MAAVPELNAAAFFDLVKSHKSFSKPSTCGPSGAIQLVSKASVTNSNSFPLM